MFTNTIREFLFLATVLFSSIIASAGVHTVTNTSDDGSGSLRWAIESAESSPGADTILFDIPNSDSNYDDGVWTIRPSSALPQLLSGGTTIDGFSQTTNQGDTNPFGPEIVIDGSNLSGSASGFEIWSSNNHLTGLVIGGFPRNGILIKTTNGADNSIRGCYIGTNENGESSFANQSHGVNLIAGAHDNRIGGTLPIERNLISGNGEHGINLEQSHHNVVVGNFIGTDRQGMNALPNGIGETKRLWNGIMVNIGSYSNRIGGSTEAERNVISGNNRTGVRLYNTGSDNNLVIGNYLGVAVDGETAIPNGECGVVMGDGALYNQIGGTQPGEENVISGNHSSGLQIRGNDTSHNKVVGNIIGADAGISKVVGNAHNGIYVYGANGDGPKYNTIGPDNVIIGNGWDNIGVWGGVRLDDRHTAFNQVTGNYIGISPDGSLSGGTCYGYGVVIRWGAHDNTVGPNNVITNQPGDGVYIEGEESIRNRVTRNTIYHNNQSTIHLVAGANESIPAPVVTHSSWTVLEGSAVSRSTVEVYSSESPDEAKVFQGRVTANNSGHFRWEGNASGPYLTALAIDNSGNTSELSATAVVPVELSSFYAGAENQSVILFWTTTSESKNLGFEVQKIAHDQAFVTLGFVKGHGTTTIPHSYTFTDSDANPGLNRYRLLQIDLDGTVTKSDILEVEVTPPRTLHLSQNYPNPFNPSTKISYELPERRHVVLRVLNVLGQQLRLLVDKEQTAGFHHMVWDGRNDAGQQVPNGIYVIELQAGDESKMVKCILAR